MLETLHIVQVPSIQSQGQHRLLSNAVSDELVSNKEIIHELNELADFHPAFVNLNLPVSLHGVIFFCQALAILFRFFPILRRVLFFA